jgi:two-component system response regulator HydG
MQRILIIDDNLDLGALLGRFLTGKGYGVETASSAARGVALFRENPFDVVLCDYRLGKQDGREVLQAVKTLRPATVVIIITGYGDIRLAVELIKMGAYDYITKPLIPDELLAIIRRAGGPAPTPLLPPEPAVDPVARLRPPSPGDLPYSASPVAREVYRQMALVAPIDYSVIIYGESGTGKEVAARTIHRLSPRHAKPFVAVDCGTLSKELAGSELFGHVKGAFTGALADKAGQFELADGGTLFLDEIANLPVDVQASLLRVIQERKLKRVGSTRETALDIRILAAPTKTCWKLPTGAVPGRPLPPAERIFPYASPPAGAAGRHSRRLPSFFSTRSTGNCKETSARSTTRCSNCSGATPGRATCGSCGT